MILIGTIANTCTIVLGTLAGAFLGKYLTEKSRKVLMDVIGISACCVGLCSLVQNMVQSRYPVLFIIALALGSLAGEKVDLDGKFKAVVKYCSSSSSSSLGEGLSTAVLLYCIGTLSILGPIRSALLGDHSFLYTNATLDLFTSAVLAVSYGIGIILAAPVLFLWQSALYFGAGALSGFLQGPLMCEISIVGGILIACSGLNILKIKEFRTMNMLPSLLVPVLFFLLKRLIGL